jgi:hypothetical protein
VGLVGLTSDGAATMVSAGKKLGIIHQLCLAHGVHLAVMDVIYKRQVEEDPKDNEENSLEVEEEDLDEEAIMAENFFLEEFPPDSVLPDLSFTYKEVIADVREIVKSFRHDRN